MTKERIKKMAIEYSKGKYGGENAKMWAIAQIHAGRDGFIAGADWRINSVWYKPEEVPEVNARLLVECAKGFELWTLEQGLSPHWKAIVELNKITRWAYLNDLIPTEDERDS